MAQRTGYKIQRKIGSSYTGKSFTAVAEDAERGHPCPRRIQHVQWLVKHWARQSVLDPFMGAGTTALACKSMGVAFIGIEIEERYCEIAAKRLSQEVFDFDHIYRDPHHDGAGA
jgi:DNA modification methylase